MADNPNQLFEVQSWRLESVRVLRLVGELDALTAPSLRATLDDALLTFGEPSVVVDLTAATFIASAGVSALVEMRQQVAQREGILIVVLPLGGRPRRVFELTGMIAFFKVEESLEEAVGAVRAAELP